MAALNFDGLSFASYGGQDDGPGDVLTEGSRVTLTGNLWKTVPLAQPFTVAESSVLNVTLSSDMVGEIIGIGLDDDTNFRNGNPLFKLGGSQNMRQFQKIDQYETADGAVSYTLSLAPWAGQSFTHLTLVNDADRIPTATAVFDKVELMTPQGPIPPAPVPAPPPTPTPTPSPTPTAPSAGALLPDPADITSYAGSQDAIVGSVFVGGGTVTLTGNGWKKLELDQPFTVTAGSYLEVTFRSDEVGEIAAIGLDDNNNFRDGNPIFKLAGNQNLKQFQKVGDWEVGDGWTTYRMDLDAWVGEDFSHLLLINDADAQSTWGSNAIFSDIQVVSGTGTPTPPAPPAPPAPPPTPPAPPAPPAAPPSAGALLPDPADITSYAGSQDAIVGSVFVGGGTVTLTGNGWKKLELDQPFTVTAGSYLEVTFRSDEVGEIAAIGLDDNNNFRDGNPIFKLAGNQNLKQFQKVGDWEVGDGWTTYRMDLDAWVGEDFSHLLLINDADAQSTWGSNAIFSDIQVVSGTGTPTPPAPAPTPTPAPPPPAPGGSLADAYGSLYVFGDSLSDAAFFGRYTQEFNGNETANWADLLPTVLQADYAPTAQYNYAVGGAQTGTTNVIKSLQNGAKNQFGLSEGSGFLAQVERFEDSNTVVAGNDIAAVWVGINDIWVSAQSSIPNSQVAPLGALPTVGALTNYVVGNIEAGLQSLVAAGFDKILLMSPYNAVDADNLPNTQATNNTVTQYSLSVRNALSNLEVAGAETYFLDMVSLLDDVQANADSFGFDFTTGETPVPDGGGLSLEQQNRYIFSDDVHLTNGFNQIIAAEAAELILTADGFQFQTPDFDGLNIV